MTDKPDEPHDPTDMSHPRYDSAKDCRATIKVRRQRQSG
jgi:hypothetical protein